MTRAPARTGAQPGSRRRGSNRGAWALLVLLLLLLLGTSAYLLRDLLFPPEPVAEVVQPPEPAPTPAPAPASKKLARPAKLAPPKPLVPDSQRQLLLKAIQARAAELKSCGRPPGSPSRLLTKIGVTQPGPVKSVGFTGQESGPKPLLDCVRAKVSGWNFADVKLASDVEVMVSFSLQAGS